MEREYYARVCRIVVDLYPTICRDCLQKQLPPPQCRATAANIRTLRPAQIAATNIVSICGNYGQCDMPLMYILATSACGYLPPPLAGWGKSPITGSRIGDDFERMMSVRKNVMSLVSEETLSVVDYRRLMDMTREICTRLDTINAPYVAKSCPGSYEYAFDAVEKQLMKEAEQNEYIEKVKELVEQEKEVFIERENFFRVSSIVVDLYSVFYRDILHKQISPTQCLSAATKLKLRPEQKHIASRVPVLSSYNECDISLMYVFLRNVCPSLPPPASGWGRPVHTSSTGVGDDIERIRQVRNEALGHVSATPISDAEFQQHVQTARNICSRMDSCHAVYMDKSVSGTYSEELLKILNENLDTDLYNDLIEELARATRYENQISEKLSECLTLEREIHGKVSELAPVLQNTDKLVTETTQQMTQMIAMELDINRQVTKATQNVVRSVEIGTDMDKKLTESIDIVENTEKKLTKLDLTETDTNIKVTQMMETLDEGVF